MTSTTFDHIPGRKWVDGRSLLVIEEDGDRRRISIHNLTDAGDEIKEYGWTASVDRACAAEVAAFLYPVELFATRPEDDYRDQFDPADFAKENR